MRLLRKPTPTQRLASGQGAHWGLIASLSLNHRSLTQEGLPALQALLRLHALPDHPVSQRQIDGITGLSQQPGTAWCCARDVRGFGLCLDEASGGARLGVNAFLLGEPSVRDRDDATYFKQP